MKIHGINYKDELEVTKEEAKHIGFGFNHEILDKCFSLRIYEDKFIFVTNNYFPQNLVNYRENYKWVLTKKLKKGDIVRAIIPFGVEIYIVDDYDTFNYYQLWYIENNRPYCYFKPERYFYKLVERD